MVARKASILLADGQYLIRYALREIIHSEPDLELIGEASSEEELLDLIATGPCPDAIIVDYFEDGFSLESIHRIKTLCKNSGIIIISADDNKKNILQTLEWGINSFLTKSCDEEEIRDAINAALGKDKYFCTKVLDYLLEKTFGESEGPDHSIPLTQREIEIVQLITKGLVAKEIAALLNLSPHTIYTHRKKIMRKLDLKTGSDLVRYAMQHGLVTVDK